MFDEMRKSIKRAINSRIIILLVVIVLMAALLVQRLFHLQIVSGEAYQNNFSLSIMKERTLNSSRGNIYDRNGKPIAYNELSYCVTFEDSGTYSSTHIKNLTVNSILYRVIKMIEEQGDSIVNDFKVSLTEDGTFEYNASGFTLNRFKADLFGEAYIENLKEEQLNITAPDLVELLCGEKYYGILDKEITAGEREEYGLPDSYTDTEILQLVSLRSAIAAYSFQRYQAVTIARDVSEQTMSRILENIADFPGIDISEEYRRVYTDAEYLAPLIGYTGKISAEELEELKKEDDSYTANDIVGKTGLESVLETTLQGDKGSEVIFVDNLGRLLDVDSRVEPQAGNDVYLTIDMDLQRAAYNILEQYIAGIVCDRTLPAETFDSDLITSADQVYIPIFDIYYALFENNVLDVSHLKAKDASENEKQVYAVFQTKAAEIFSTIKNELLSDSPTSYKDLENAYVLGEQYQVYMSYIVNDMLMNDTGILNESAIDKTDPMYLAWTEEENISLQEYLTYAISKNWIDITKIASDTEYMDTREMFTALADYIADYLYEDDNFCKQVYRYMLQEGRISGSEICLLLFDQGVLEMDTSDYENLQSGTLSGYNFMIEKIANLEITPAQLAVTPCSGSLVLTDPNSGDVLACVTYPGYDNNRLANEMDTEYFNKLNMDKSSPFYSRATQEAIAPGSTFKMVTAVAGVMEGVVNLGEGIGCTGKFDLVAGEPINCWNKSGHGVLTLETAITESCNYFFNTIGYRLASVSGEYDDDTGLATLTKYASQFGLDEKSGVEVPESAPNISQMDAVRTAMGQADNLFTTTQLARYVGTVANGGTCYYLTLVDSVTDSAGSVLEENETRVRNTVELPQELWNTIYAGMRGVARNNAGFEGFDFNRVTVAGKTGTAQIATDIPNHGVFVGYANAVNSSEPEIAIAVRIANGYSSTNAALVARDMLSYYYDLEPEEEIITGYASTPYRSNDVND
ncbi:MAG: penicillin-binding transpeptidase domain-containing protein [Lachnospiraceae bacterium]|nr:penicillin-binding transpeptidase domain-containing protein [Lachnospiraceae bacterium]